MRVNSLTALAVVALSPLVLADYQYEVEISPTRFALDADVEAFSTEIGETDLDTNSVQLSASYYFEPIATKGVPLSLADYLAHASSVSFQHNINKTDREVHIAASDPINGHFYDYQSDESDDATLTRIVARIVTQETPFIFEFGIGSGDGDVDFKESEFESHGGVIQIDRQIAEKFDYDIDYYQLSFGGYLSDTSSLQFGYSQEKTDYEPPIDDNKEKVASISYENVIRGDDNSSIWYSLSFENQEIESDEDLKSSSVGVWFSYFPNYTFQAGAGLDFSSGDVQGQIISLFVEKFVTENFGLAFFYSYASLDSEITSDIDQEADGNSVSILAQMRF